MPQTYRRAHGRRPAAPAEKPLARASIRVAEPVHLWSVQTMTRALCRAIGLEEPEVYRALISVTELAHRLFIARGRAGEIDLAVVRREGGLGLEVRAEGADGPALLTLVLPVAEASPYS